MKAPLVFFDLETAGLESHHADIQIAAAAVVEWEILETFERKIRFEEADADPAALALNSYDREVWKREQVYERQALVEFAAWMEPYRSVEFVSKRTGRPYSVARLAGHNAASFDAPRLIAAFKRLGLFLPADSYRPLDTLQLALWRLADASPALPDFKLGTIAEHIGIETPDAHDALGDVRTTVAVARALCGQGAP